jgi:chromosome segregation ATPase
VSERFAEAERARNGALQEAAFYRAKLSAYESNSPTEVARLDRDRCTELERQLAQVMAERDAQDHRVLELNESAAAQAKLLEEAEERAADATHRAELLEDVHSRTTADHAELQHKHAATESALRDHQDRVLSLSSLAQQHEAEQSSVLSQLEEFKASRDQNMRALEQIRIAVTAADARAEEADAQLRRATAQISRLEGEVHDTRAELEARSHECDVATARLADVENAWTKSREEADAFRAATTSGLGELLDTHRDLRADEDRAVRGHAEKVKAMEMESTSLRKMLKEAGIRVDEAQANLADHRKRAQNLESDQITLRSQLAGLRSQLADATAEAARLRKEISVRDSELREKSKVASEADVRLGMLRNVLADRGIIIDEKDIGSKASDASATRIAELETQLADSERHYDELERDMKEALRQKQTAVEKVDALSTQLDRARTSSRTPDSGSLAAAEARANEAERKLALSEQHHKERLQQVEYDYQMAISYVK